MMREFNDINIDDDLPDEPIVRHIKPSVVPPSECHAIIDEVYQSKAYYSNEDALLLQLVNATVGKKQDQFLATVNNLIEQGMASQAGDQYGILREELKKAANSYLLIAEQMEAVLAKADLLVLNATEEEKKKYTVAKNHWDHTKSSAAFFEVLLQARSIVGRTVAFGWKCITFDSWIAHLLKFTMITEPLLTVIVSILDTIAGVLIASDTASLHILGNFMKSELLKLAGKTIGLVFALSGIKFLVAVLFLNRIRVSIKWNSNTPMTLMTKPKAIVLFVAFGAVGLQTLILGNEFFQQIKGGLDWFHRILSTTTTPSGTSVNPSSSTTATKNVLINIAPGPTKVLPVDSFTILDEIGIVQVQAIANATPPPVSHHPIAVLVNHAIAHMQDGASTVATAVAKSIKYIIDAIANRFIELIKSLQLPMQQLLDDLQNRYEALLDGWEQMFPTKSSTGAFLMNLGLAAIPTSGVAVVLGIGNPMLSICGLSIGVLMNAVGDKLHQQGLAIEAQVKAKLDDLLFNVTVEQVASLGKFIIESVELHKAFAEGRLAQLKGEHPPGFDFEAIAEVSPRKILSLSNRENGGSGQSEYKNKLARLITEIRKKGYDSINTTAYERHFELAFDLNKRIEAEGGQKMIDLLSRANVFLFEPYQRFVESLLSTNPIQNLKTIDKNTYDSIRKTSVDNLVNKSLLDSALMKAALWTLRATAPAVGLGVPSLIANQLAPTQGEAEIRDRKTKKKKKKTAKRKIPLNTYVDSCFL